MACSESELLLKTTFIDGWERPTYLRSEIERDNIGKSIAAKATPLVAIL